MNFRNTGIPMKTDRSGRTLEEYRQLYWDGKERIKELQAKLDAVKALPDKWREKEYATATGECPLDIQNCADELDKAIGEQE